ncbi:anthrone oxygenase family protein [Pontimicrobium sp. SW4]|uniref:Anthrone oxygenase family protein n=1 Tax=Pontimicrobium sp. SW4 TaxID=3153519 RepID=A0AAU7BPC4_9FLAO
MEINLKTVTLLLAILITGLSAGLFYAWKISVIPGLKNISDRSYLGTMQSINRAILNPEFYIIFFGAILFLILSAYFQFKVSIDNSFWLITAAILFYGIGTIGVTAFGNVPMNESLDLVDLTKLNVEELRLTRLHYEGQWNQFNTIRTVFSVLSFIAILVSSFLNESISIKI